MLINTTAPYTNFYRSAILINFKFYLRLIQANPFDILSVSFYLTFDGRGGKREEHSSRSS